MKPFSTIVRMHLGGFYINMTTEGPVHIVDNEVDQNLMIFDVPVNGVTPPARSVDFIGTGVSSGSLQFAISLSDFDAISHIASGGKIIDSIVECKLVFDDRYYDECYTAFKGVVTSIQVDVEEHIVSINAGPAFKKVDTQFPATSVGDDKRFPDSPEGTRSRAIPVIYGMCRRVPVPIVAYLDSGKVARILLASHPVFGSRERPGFVQIGNNKLGDMVEYYEVSEGVDGLGAFYSYIDIPSEHWDDSVYIVSMFGKLSSSGGPIERLGDTLDDIWASYANASSEYFDSARARRASRKLNSIRVAMALTEAQNKQSVIDIVAGRLQNMPLRLSFDRGMFAWDAVFWPSSDQSSGNRVIFESNALQRGPVQITDTQSIANKFRFKMSFDARFQESSETRMVDHTSSNLLNLSKSLFGETSIEEIDISDASDKSGAGIAIDNIIRSRSVPRLTVSYSGMSPTLLDSELGQLWKIDDAEAGLRDSPAVLVGVKPEVETGTTSLSFVTLEDYYTTLRKSAQEIIEVSAIAASNQQQEEQEEEEQEQETKRYGVYLQLTDTYGDAASVFQSASYIGIRTHVTNSGDLSEREGYEVILENDGSYWQILESHPTQTSSIAKFQYIHASLIPFEYTSFNIVKGQKKNVLINMQVYPLDQNFARIATPRFNVKGFMRLGQTVLGIMNDDVQISTMLGSHKIGYGYLNVAGSGYGFSFLPRTIDGVENQIRYFEEGHNIIWRNHTGLWPREKLVGAALAAYGYQNYWTTELQLSNRTMITTGLQYFTDTFPGAANNSRQFSSLTDEDIWKNDVYGLDYYGMTEAQRDALANQGKSFSGSNNGRQVASGTVSGSTYTGPASYYGTIQVIGFITPSVLENLGSSQAIFNGQEAVPTRRTELVLLKFADTTFVNDIFNYPQNWSYIGESFNSNNMKFIHQGGDTDKPYLVAGKHEDASSTSERWWLFVSKIGHTTELDTSQSMVISTRSRAYEHTITPHSAVSGYHICAPDTEFTSTIYNSIVDGTTELTDSNGNKWLVQKKNSQTHPAVNHAFVTPVNHSEDPGNFDWT
tara:strand:- start:41992 stop:45159 length:3168 start_codon:yes stop_codon:yes gene_type:complete